MSVQRWTAYSVRPVEGGGFVAYGDYLTLAREADRLRAAIREYLAAYDAASDPQATGSTCRLIRAEGELRRAVDGEPSHE